MLILQRLTQHLQHTVPKLWQLIQKQHSVMRQRHLARLWVLTTTNQRHRRCQMVRCSERTTTHKSSLCTQLTRHRVYLGGLQSLLTAHRGQDGRHTPCQHSLSRSWRTYHYHIMTSRRRNLHSSLDVSLPLHIGEVILILFVYALLGHNTHYGLKFLLAIQHRGKFQQRPYGIDLKSLHHCRLGSILLRNIYLLETLCTSLGSNGQHTLHSSQATIQRQLTHKDRLLQHLGWELLRSGKYCHRNGQIETRTLLP